MSYWLGVATPIVVALVGFLVLAYLDNVQRSHIAWEHKGCRGWHAFRPWLPSWLLKRTLMPISVWRCNRGKQVPLMAWHSQGRDRSNDPEDEA